MLFFKEIVDKKFADKKFHKFYEKECHICLTTVKVIAELEKNKNDREEILRKLHISEKAYGYLKEAKYCDPELVKQLCCYFGFDEANFFQHCNRSK